MLRKICAALLLILFFAGAVRAEDDAPVVVLETSEGCIYLKLFPDVAPKAVNNFLALVRKNYYNKTIFHRVIKGFMIQGGDPSGTGAGGMAFDGVPFKDEVVPELAFDRPGLLAMANTGPNTNGSQFFITTGPAQWLNLKHTIFGEVISGEDVVRVIEYADTSRNDKPFKAQKIIRAYVEGDMEADTY